MTLEEFNGSTEQSARGALELCCVSKRWVDGVIAERPFNNHAALKHAADQVWMSLREPDFLEAFEGHPKIGDVDSLKMKYAGSSALAAGEQSSVAQANDDIILRLAQGNALYEKTFGFIFIICATGKTAQEMCDLLEARISNSREEELRTAAEEQRKILQLRLDAMQ